MYNRGGVNQKIGDLKNQYGMIKQEMMVQSLFINKSNTTTQSKIFEKEMLGNTFVSGIDKSNLDQLPPAVQQKRLATRQEGR